MEPVSERTPRLCRSGRGERSCGRAASAAGVGTGSDTQQTFCDGAARPLGARRGASGWVLLWSGTGKARGRGKATRAGRTHTGHSMAHLDGAHTPGPGPAAWPPLARGLGKTVPGAGRVDLGGGRAALSAATRFAHSRGRSSARRRLSRHRREGGGGRSRVGRHGDHQRCRHFRS